MSNGSAKRAAMDLATVGVGGIAAGEFSVGGLKLAADMFGFRWPFEVVPLPGTRMLVDSGDAEKFRRAIMVLRRRTSIVALQACCH